MDAIPVIAFAAYSGTGKTTLIEQLIPRLRAKGLQLAVIKHDGHQLGGKNCPHRAAAPHAPGAFTGPAAGGYGIGGGV